MRKEQTIQTSSGKVIRTMKFYVVNYEDDKTRYANFNSYIDCLNYAKSRFGCYDFTIEEYDSEEDYFNNL